jgi:exopolysaccharide biosynthesis polyprenyl glycosylphosphotransferase
MSDSIRIRNGVGKPSSEIIRPSFLGPSDDGFAAKRVLLVGTGALAARAARDSRRERRPVCIVGAVDSNPRANWCSQHPDIPVLGGPGDVESIAAERCIDEIRVALAAASDQATVKAIEAIARHLGIPMIRYSPQPVARSSQFSDGHQAGVVIHRAEHPSNRGASRIVKRCVDVLISGSALLVLAPLMGAIAIAIKLTSPGPVLFRQQRIGRHRRQFRMLKFRTMLRNAEDLRARVREHNNARGISFKVFDDPRVTRIGAILRRSSLDELPQLLNVLVGQMSLVGPRPIPIWVAEQMRGTAYLRRFSVQQGLTGLWQVDGRQQDFDHMATLDVRYVQNWSLAGDFRILLRTIPAVIRGEGAH